MLSVILVAPSNSLKSLSSFPWKTSLATLMSNGSHNHLNLHHGMLNVVEGLLSRSMEMHYYPEVASTRKTTIHLQSVVESDLLFKNPLVSIFVLLKPYGLKLISGFFTWIIELIQPVFL